MSPLFPSAPATHAALAEAIDYLCREASRLIAEQDYRGALDCFARAAALLNEQERHIASDAKFLDLTQN
jgi:hypothetical protein